MVKLTLDADAGMRGLNYIKESTVANLDVSGTHLQFADSNVPTEVIIEIGENGAWNHLIAVMEEASGVISEGFDLTKSYHVVIYGQDDNGGGKTIHSVSLDTCSADSTLGTQDLTMESSINIYPNPVKSTFQILNQNGSKIEIYNLLGVLQLEENILSDKHTENANRLASGMYVARVINGTHVKLFKIIKR